MMLSGQCFVFLFRQGTERPHQGDVNTRVANPNTTKEVRNRIMLDPAILENPSFVCGDGGGGQKSYCLVVEHLQDRKLNRDLEFCDVGSSCNVGRWGLRLGGVVWLMIGGRRHDVNMPIG
jgi:hypothetical protein